jgi:capsular polysaccharide biosynthesis protein
MELNQVVRRVIGQHWRLIVCFVVVICGVAVVLAGGSRGYTASARLVLDTADPKARTESESIADTGKALATSPTLVKAALDAERIHGRNAVDIAEHDVSVAPLGTSGVLRLDVTDRNRHVAARLANALADQVIQTRLSISNGEVDSVMADLNRRVEDINRKMSALDAKVDSLNIQAANAASARQSNALRAQRDDAARSRDFLAQQRSVVEAERVAVLSNASNRPKPRIVSKATAPLHADSSRRLQTGLLAAIVGLILGVGLAALRETFRPTIVGGDAVARALGVPLLGTISVDEDGHAKRDEAAAVAGRLQIAARSLRNVSLVAASPSIDVARIANWLERPSNGNNGATAGQLRIRALAPDDLPIPGEAPDSVAIVSPPSLVQAQLDSLGDLVRLLSVPAIGLIVCEARNDGPNLRTAVVPQGARERILGRRGRRAPEGRRPSSRARSNATPAPANSQSEPV